MEKPNERLCAIGVFDTRHDVECLVERLKRNGFTNSDISVLIPDWHCSRKFSPSTWTEAPERAAAGAGAGILLGGTLGWLVGVGTLGVPGIGHTIAAGPVIGLLTGAGFGGAIGALTGALIGLGIPEHDAKKYEGYIKDGGILVTVHASNPDFATTAKRLMREENGRNIRDAQEDFARAVSEPVEAKGDSHLSHRFV